MAVAPSLAATTTATVAAAFPAVVVFGLDLGLRSDVLVAGFLGSVAAQVLMDSPGPEKPSWGGVWLASLRRLFVAAASSLTAGYLVGGTEGFVVSSGMTRFSAFVIGAGAQTILPRAIANLKFFNGPAKGV